MKSGNPLTHRRQLRGIWLALLAGATSALAGIDLFDSQNSPFEAGHCQLRHLRVVDDSNDGTSFIVRVDYDYDGFGKPPLRLTPSFSKQGSREKLGYFDANGATVPAGRGTALFKVRYRTEDSGIPMQITTDKISIWATNTVTKSLVSVASFAPPISWGGPDAFENRPANPARTVEVAALPGPPIPPKLDQPATLAAPAIQPAPAQTAALSVPATTAPAPETDDKVEFSGSLSASLAGNRATWQERLTLGPGDVLNFALFGEPELSRTEVFIGPDGRISYLEAAGVFATGLTVDELRGKFDEELGKYRRAPHTIITPAAFRSKKYFVLGKVSQKGVFTLDHPLTIVEAVARARGLETGVADRNIVEIADLSRSFLVRHGQRMTVDFENLFMHGDLSQNLPLEPDDYLYFPPNDLREAYVLGEVNRPGPVAFSANSTAINSIAQRGGFTSRAWTRKILVIRGSLTKPETFVVDATSILAAGTPDFKLQPKDIVYISARPWIKAEELLDAAATAFTEAVVVTWTGGNVGTFIR